MERALTRLWYGNSAAGVLLQPLASLYGGVTALRRGLYASGVFGSYAVGRPVIVVGNLTVGGTGKTPLVAWLAERLKAHRLSVGILSRGYGSSGSTPRYVGAKSTWQDVGDEPLLLHERTGCPTVVATNRVEGARMLVSQRADVIIADDGLQHLRLKRDCEIVVVDGSRGFGNGRLLPAGPLRERAERIVQADIVVTNGPPMHQSLAQLGLTGEARSASMSLIPGNVVPVDGRYGARTLESFRGKPVHAVAGIGNPERFFADLRGRGLTLIEHAFPDHHPFTGGDLDFSDGAPILMTEKDAVKCRALANDRLWYVPVTARFSDAQAEWIMERVLKKLGFAVNERG